MAATASAGNSTLTPLAEIEKRKAAAEEERRRLAAADDDDKDKDKDATEDDDEEKEKKARAKKKAEDDEKKEKEDKENARASDDDAGDAADEANPAVRSARARERSRVKAILHSEAGKTNARLAQHLAFNTSMPREQAVGMLMAAGPSGERSRSLGDRMAAVDAPNPGPGDADLGADAGSAAAAANFIVNSGKKARGEVA